MTEYSEIVITRGSREEIRAKEAPGGGIDIRVWFRKPGGQMGDVSLPIPNAWCYRE